MQLALKFEEDPVDLSAGIETVVFRKQMLVELVKFTRFVAGSGLL